MPRRRRSKTSGRINLNATVTLANESAGISGATITSQYATLNRSAIGREVTLTGLIQGTVSGTGSTPLFADVLLSFDVPKHLRASQEPNVVGIGSLQVYNSSLLTFSPLISELIVLNNGQMQSTWIKYAAFSAVPCAFRMTFKVSYIVSRKAH